jgi:glycerophosphoryl diester phosphodiesterase
VRHAGRRDPSSSPSIPGLLALGLLFGAGCGGDDGPTDGAPPDAPGERDGASADAGSDPILDPHLFDCTSPGAADVSMSPARASLVPTSCGLDVTCLTPQVSGHRGAGGALGRIAPEDTLAAYRAGIALGLEYVETDPRPTADGVLVNVHDSTVDRTTDGTGAVDAMTFDEVRALHIRTELPGDFACERIPTLEEILRTCRERVLVLVDANKTDRVDLLVDAIHAADALEWAIFDTSSTDKIDQALALEPGLHFMIRPDSVEQITTQLDHFDPLVPVIVELNLGDVEPGAPLVHGRGTRVLTDVFAADALFNLSEDPMGYVDALGAGADILQTDRPDAIVALLQARGDR